ncbi:MAG: MFS transporter, partial [Clostridiales bacterium]|nr:MFS transporter [Clostridiales bacterium]
VTFFICAALMLLSFILSLQLKSEAVDRTQPFKISLNKIVAPEVLLPTLVIFFIAFAYSGINSFIAIYGELSGVKEIGLYFTASAVCMIFIRPVSGKIADKYGHDKSVIPGLIILIAAFVLISFSRSLPMFILAGAVTAFGFGSSQPIIQTMIMQLVPKARRGAAGNTNFIGIDCTFLIGPTVAGIVITAVQKSSGSEITAYSTMFRLMVIPVLFAMGIFWVYRKKLLSRIKAHQEAGDMVGRLQQISSDS